mmetsp:Transcript_4855/g.13617  ORF Transcript_4855/g.13617 Transcript_4855/m.13617 type:complete len:208 (+) Transcript_4855:143-766(+)
MKTHVAEMWGPAPGGGRSTKVTKGVYGERRSASAHLSTMPIWTAAAPRSRSTLRSMEPPPWRIASAVRGAPPAPPATPKAAACTKTVGWPASSSVASSSSAPPSSRGTWSTVRLDPVGRRAPVTLPCVAEKSRSTRAPVPGTPAIAASPSTSALPSGPTGTVALRMAPVFVLWMRTRRSPLPGAAGSRPSSTANGPTPAEMFPQFPL